MKMPIFQKLKTFQFGVWIPIATFVSGVVIGFGVPVWQNYWVERPELIIELSSIARNIAEDATIDYTAYSELNFLKPDISRLHRQGYLAFYVRHSESMEATRKRIKKGQVKIEELEEALIAAKTKLKTLPDQLKDRKAQLIEAKALTPKTVTVQKLTELNRPTGIDVSFKVSEFEQKKDSLVENEYYFKNLIKQFVEKYTDQVTTLEEQLNNIQTNFPSAERRIETIRKDMLQTRSFFVVTTALTNSGRSSTSIKKPALLRVYIGTGNYVDLKLFVDDYKVAAQIPDHGTKIVTLRSSEVHSLPDEDRALINTYWQQSVHAILFLEDTFGVIHNSNRIAFAEGLSQKIVFDRLAKEASLNKHFIPTD
jgi:hypothetical protein